MNKRTKILLFILLLQIIFSIYTYAASGDDWLHTMGNKILDKNNNIIRITGINWFGYDTNQCVFHGLWSRDLKSVLDQAADLGFNTIRVPIHAELVAKWSQGIEVMTQGITIIASGNNLLNDYLQGLDTLEILDCTIDYCSRIGLKLILDMHSIQPDGNDQNLWYNENFTLADFIAAWKFLITRYKDTDTVLGVDLKNEPHGFILEEGANAAKWDSSGDPNNWKNAAEIIGREILAINPNLLILVEGVQQYYDKQINSLYNKLGLEHPGNVDPALHTGWWGGNLIGVKSYPVMLGNYQDKLVYAPHEYGPNVYAHPWFFSGYNRSSMEIVWEHFWSFIDKNNIAPVLIGEWGGKISGADNASNLVWMTALRDKIIEMNWNHTFWCLNENSSDTGGILSGSQWENVDEEKYAFIKNTLWQDTAGNFIGLDHEINLGRYGTNVSKFYRNRTSVPPSSTPIPTRSPTPGPSVTQQPSPTFSPGFTSTSTGMRKGDVNGDGAVTIVDALMTAQYYVGLNPPGFSAGAADVNNDGAITIVDALMIAQYYVGLISF